MCVWISIFFNLVKIVEGMLALRNNYANNISGYKLRYDKLTAQETEWIIRPLPHVDCLARLRIENELNELGRSELPSRIVNECVN